MSTLLALDLSSNVGWALFDPSLPKDRRVRFGTLAWGGEGYAAVAGKFLIWLIEFYSVERWDGMAWEEPWLKAGDKVDKMKILLGMPFMACGFAKAHNLPFTSVQPKELKKRMTDRQDADKADVIAACWSVGWKVGSEHEADACGVGLVAYDRIFP